MPGQFGSPVVRQRRLAAELRRLRERMGLTGDEVAKQLNWSASKLSRFELGRSVPKPGDLARLLDRYGVAADRRAELIALAGEATGKGWWEAYSDVLPDQLMSLIGMEAEARSSWIWHVELIPGLLQTKEYAREVNQGFQRIAHVPPAHMERRLEARLARQQILTRDPPFELSVVLDESALRRRMADNAVMRNQLMRLIEVAELPNVDLRVMPLERLHPIVADSFILLRFGEAHDTRLSDVVYTEQLSSNLYFEDETETYLYQVAFEYLVDAALPPQGSVDLIFKTAHQLWAS
jgi:transcriptional regulator with XRE-family HTH domain